MWCCKSLKEVPDTSLDTWADCPIAKLLKWENIHLDKIAMQPGTLVFFYSLRNCTKSSPKYQRSWTIAATTAGQGGRWECLLNKLFKAVFPKVSPSENKFSGAEPVKAAARVVRVWEGRAAWRLPFRFRIQPSCFHPSWQLSAQDSQATLGGYPVARWLKADSP